MIPARGTMVDYTLDEADAQRVNSLRASAQSPYGNPAKAGQVYPMLVVRRWGQPGVPTPTPVNGQVFLDGNDTLWVTSVSEGIGPGCFQLI